MLHIGKYLATGAEEYVGISVLVIKFGYWAVEAALACEGKSKTMHESLAFLAVALRGKGVDAVGDKLEEGFEFAFICHKLLFSPDVRTVKCQVIFFICIKEIRENLLTHNLIGNYKFYIAHVSTAYSHHTEIVKQAEEIVVVGNILCGESFLQLTCHVAFRHQCLDDGGIMCEFLVLVDEHT